MRDWKTRERIGYGKPIKHKQPTHFLTLILEGWLPLIVVQKRPKRQIKSTGIELILLIQRSPSWRSWSLSKADEELPLRQIFDEVCRTVDAGGKDVTFVTIESSMYKRRRTAVKFAYRSTRCRRTITGSGSVSLGDVPFYRGSVNTGDSDTALIFERDRQLELLRWCHLVYVDATFRVVPSLFYQVFTVFVQQTDHSLQ